MVLYRVKPNGLPRIMMVISGVIMLFTTAPVAVKIFTNTTMLVVAIWLWLRPEPKPVTDKKQIVG